MGLEKVSSNAPASQAQSSEQQPKASTKLTEEQFAKLELPKVLAQGKKSKTQDKPQTNANIKDLPAALKKKEGISDGAKLALGAAAIGVAATVLSFVKPSAGKALKLAAQAAPAAKKGLQGKHAVMAVGGLAGTSILAGCGKDILDEEHNHFVPLPSDTVIQEKIVEKIIEKPVYITKTDTIIKNDTIELPGEIIIERDTIFKHDTIEVQLPGEIVYVKEDFESKVPEKIKEMFDDLGIDTTGVGKFVYGIDYQDEKNNQVHRSLWDGGRTSRDGDVYVMNDIGTKWDHDAEDYTFGKNEEFKRHELYLNDSKALSNCENTPLSPINVSNNNGAPNWYIFKPGEPTAEPGNWVRNTPKSFTKVSDGKWQSSDGFTYEKGEAPNSIRKTNAHGSTWLLKNVSIIGGNDAKDPK